MLHRGSLALKVKSFSRKAAENPKKSDAAVRVSSDEYLSEGLEECYRLLKMLFFVPASEELDAAI
jgi:hypothetical protein